MLRTILGGCVGGVLSTLAIVLGLSCSSPSALQCRLDAVSRLPLSAVEDPDSLTLGDVRGLARELKACRVVEASDAGAD